MSRWAWPLLGGALLVVAGLHLFATRLHTPFLFYLAVVALAALSQRRPLVLAATAATVVLLTASAAVSLLTRGLRAAGREINDTAVALAAILACGALGLVLPRSRERLLEAQGNLGLSRDLLAEQHALLATTGDVAHFGGWSVDLGTRLVHWSDEVARMHGMEPGFVGSLDAGIEFYAPEDRDRVQRLVQDCLGGRRTLRLRGPPAACGRKRHLGQRDRPGHHRRGTAP